MKPCNKSPHPDFTWKQQLATNPPHKTIPKSAIQGQAAPEKKTSLRNWESKLKDCKPPILRVCFFGRRSGGKLEEKNGTYPRKSHVGQLEKTWGCRILSCLNYFESQKTEVKADVELFFGKCPYNLGQQQFILLKLKHSGCKIMHKLFQVHLVKCNLWCVNPN